MEVDPMRKEYDFSKLKELKNPYPGKKKAANHKDAKAQLPAKKTSTR